MLKTTSSQSVVKPAALLPSFTLLLSVAIVPVEAVADSLKSGRDLIGRMSVAMQELSYTGTYIYAHEGDVETMRIEHSKADGVERERLLSLNGEAREIVRNADSVIGVRPGTKSITVREPSPRAPFPEFDAEQLAQLEKLYRFNPIGRDRVAGRLAEVVDIKPLDEYRYGYRLWIDAETFMMLRSAMSDKNQRIIEQVMFTDVNYVDALPAELFRSSLEGERQEWLLQEDADAEEPKPDTDIPGVEKRAIPDGFTVMSDKVLMLPGKSKVRRVMYTDGLASLSVYVSNSGSKDALYGRSGMGAVHAYGAGQGNWHVTVVGEVPMVTVDMLGKSLVLADQ